jgi:hypothetical protein
MSEWEYRVDRLGAPPMEGDTGRLEELDESIRKEIENVLSQSDGTDLDATDSLSRFGSDGWKLVSTFPDSGSIVWIFRRQVE